MITEDFVSFNVAKLLKEKGFDELCIFKYNSEGVRVKAGEAIDEWQNSELDDDEYSCPSQSMAMKWLREVHHITILISMLIQQKGKYGFFVCNSVNADRIYNNYDGVYDSYEETVEAALKYCLEKLI